MLGPEAETLLIRDERGGYGGRDKRSIRECNIHGECLRK
ncbi:hypothetical protein FMK81_22410 [Klebsiella oxytoca]|nr:hypothetical protein [Klebsiella oxytoca]NHA25695.1 hypothetical protein [Enterobacter roggenkampii]PXI16390.1 hypothetical protein DMP65_25690 [Klebsiella pneumoniae]TNA55761.1 hypothetical protein EMF73_02800 [Klebsiella pneumoniae]HBY9297744.1 hypothetical protein [Klebsiella pneumoniae]